MASQDIKEPPLEFHSAHGGKMTFHGCSYQLKLLMLFIVRGLRNNLCFRVATEMLEAGKFDDVVFKQTNGNGEQYRFLQAKHSAGEAKSAITARNLLLGAKGDFCLPMYFQSYQTIKANPKFSGKNKEIKDLILFTNKGFKYQDRFCDFELREDIFEREKLEDGEDKVDEILKTGLLHFKKDFDGKSFLVSHLKNAFVEIPKSFAECVIKGEVFHLEQNLRGKASDSYGEVLLKEVMDAKAQSFRSSFIEAENLTPEARHFRDVLKSESFNKHHGDENAFREEMRNLRVKVVGKIKHGGIKIDSPAKVAEKLASLMRKNWDQKTVVVTDCRSAIARNVKVLADNVFVRNMNGETRFNPEFISGNNLRAGIVEFRKLLSQEIKKRNLEFTNINQFKFEIKNFEEASALPSLPNNELMEAFLEKLVFAVDQPNETELDKLIKEELLKEFRVIEAENVYGRFLVKTFNWMTDIRGTELSHEEGRIFFEHLKKEMLTSVRFRVKHPSTNFTGREKELDALQEALEEDVSDQWHISQSVVIVGIAGVGKTELAKKYTFLHSGEYDNIIWINAKSNDAISNSFRRLAFEKLGIRKENVNGGLKSLEFIVSDVYDYLRGKSSLFIFDGARKLGNRRGDFGIRKFLPKFPSESKHYALITSRYQKWGDMKQIHLDTFSEKEALELIGKSINLESLNEISQARNLADALQYYPLALQQALSYIKASNEERVILGGNYTISNYLKALEDMSKELLDFPLEIHGRESYAEGTYSTWEITIRDIKTKKGGKLAVKILSVISYFAPDDISLENISTLFQDKDNSSLIQSLLFLKRYSLISIEQDKVSIHKLVQMITRLRLKEENKEEGMLKRILRVGEKMDVEHSQSIWEYSTKYDSLIKEFSNVPSRIIQKLTDNLKFAEAEEFARKTLKILDKQSVERHESALNVKENLAIAVSYQGRYEEALKIYEELYKDRLLTQKSCHSRVLKIKHYIANTLCSLGRYQEALTFYKDVLGVVSFQFGEEHIDTLCVENNIANVLYHLRDYQKAFSSYEKVYKTMKVSIGEDHEKTLNAKLNLANALAKLGQLEKALRYYQEVYEVSKDSLNGNPLMVLDAKFNMASAFGKLRKYGDALHAYEQVLEKLTEIFGADHPDTLDTMYNICYVLYKLKEYDRALKLYQEVGKTFSRIYGENHEKTFHCNFSTAHILCDLGFYRKALHQYQDIYGKLVQSKEVNHPKLLLTNQCIANTLYNLGECDKAVQIYKEIYEKQSLQYGEKDERTISSKRHLARVLFDLSEYQEACELYTAIYQLMSRQHGELNEDTLTAKYNMACALNKMGRLYESIVYFRDIRKKQIEILGEEHPLTKSTEEILNEALLKVQNRKSETFSYVNYVKATEKAVLNVEGEAKNVDDVQSEQDCRLNCPCVSLLRCLRPIKTLLT